MRPIFSLTVRQVVRLCAPAAVMLSIAVAQSPTPATFSKEFYRALSGTSQTIAVDLNNDGTKDLVTINGHANLIAVQLSDGKGGFAPKFDWAVNHGLNSISLASGDLNQDGNADVVLADGTQTINIFFGNGHGDYCRSCPNLIAPFAVESAQIADFNHDGHPDIAASNGQSVAIFYGNGKGQFSAPSMVFSQPDVVSGLVAGDFDGDTNADLAFTGQIGCDKRGNCTTPFAVLYGDGKGKFTKGASQSFNFLMTMDAYDVNQDGRSDIIFTAGCVDLCASGIGVAYGLGNRTFDVKRSATPGFLPSPDAPVAADFNGDGFVDLAVSAKVDSNNFDQGVLVAQADKPYGSWGQQHFQDLGVATFPNRPVTGDWNRDLEPDLLTVESFPQPTSQPAQIVELLNTSLGKLFPVCAYPSLTTGINVCTPVQGSIVGHGVRFTAAVNSFSPVRKLEVWLDGVKIKEVFKTWMDFTLGVAPGAHRAVFFSAGYDNTLQAKTVNFNVGQGDTCPAPSAPGLNVCSPVSGLVAGLPVHVLARGTVAGTIARMEVWIDGTKRFSTFGSSTLETSLPLTAGTHSFGFYVVSTTGTKFRKDVLAAVRPST